jgi:hypothetical protein
LPLPHLLQVICCCLQCCAPELDDLGGLAVQVVLKQPLVPVIRLKLLLQRPKTMHTAVSMIKLLFCPKARVPVVATVPPYMAYPTALAAEISAACVGARSHLDLMLMTASVPAATKKAYVIAGVQRSHYLQGHDLLITLIQACGQGNHDVSLLQQQLLVPARQQEERVSVQTLALNTPFVCSWQHMFVHLCSTLEHLHHLQAR